MGEKEKRLEERIEKRKEKIKRITEKIKKHSDDLKEEKRLLKKDEKNLVHLKYDELLKTLVEKDIEPSEILEKIGDSINENEERDGMNHEENY